MHLTPSRSLSGVSLATTEASSGGSEKQNGRRKKSKKKASGDSKPNFTLKDYDNICFYIEEEENYDHLFGKSTKMNIGKWHMNYLRDISMLLIQLLRSVVVTVHNGLVHIKKIPYCSAMG
ncbi:hypothetical protein O181_066513 [Austropuccinia psidii MF-1]|uniref:Uncharacterized protein n=1 Tax=Austropuccinia psidii MF-1 TaxID=1389203 RepID=A0A9Q3EX90_9BASI|nr:hypothetical protein [Austropuccinia psidii MF-1]